MQQDKGELEKRVIIEILRIKISGITVKELAKRANLSNTTAWRLLNNVYGIKADTIFKLDQAGIINVLYGYSHE